MHIIFLAYLVTSNRMLRVGSDGNVGWGANLPVCHILRRGIDVYSQYISTPPEYATKQVD